MGANRWTPLNPTADKFLGLLRHPILDFAPPAGDFNAAMFETVNDHLPSPDTLHPELRDKVFVGPTYEKLNLTTYTLWLDDVGPQQK